MGSDIENYEKFLDLWKAADPGIAAAENTFYRYKRIIGGRLRAKNDDAQKREAAIGCAILNRIHEMGEPLSYAVG